MTASLSFVLLTYQAANADDAEISSHELCRRMYAPVINVRYGDYSGSFLVDSGASSTSVSGPPSLIENADPTWLITSSRVQTQTGSVPVKVIHGMPLFAFGRTLTATQVLYKECPSDLVTTVSMDGILGIPQFSDGVLRVNLRDSICEFPAVVPRHDFGTELRYKDMSPTKRIPRITATLPQCLEHHAYFDTGSSFFFTMQKIFIDNLIDAGLMQKGGAAYGVTVRGYSRSESFILRRVIIEGYDFRDVLVLQTEVNTLGREFIDCFDTFVDFPKNQIWLKPLETEWPLRIAPDASGLVLAYRDTDHLQIAFLEPDSAAVEAGLQQGDRVLLFDGKSPKDTSMRAMRKRLTEAGTTVKLKVLRDGKELDIDLPLSRSYEYPPKWPELNTDADDFFKSLQNEKKPAAE